MAGSTALIASVAFAFAHADATQLRMTVELTDTASVSLRWANTRRASAPARRHVFDALPHAGSATVAYALTAGPSTRRGAVGPLFGPTTRLAIIGGDGPGRDLRAALDAAIDRADVHAVINLGPERAFAHPVIGGGRPPVDPVGASFGLPPHVHHVRLGSGVVMVLDPSLGLGHAQARFVRAVCAPAAGPRPRWRVVVVPHGPWSSGPQGGHPRGPELVALAAEAGIDVIVSGHERAYERLAAGETTAVVSGLSGLDHVPQARRIPESRAFLSAPHWVHLALGAQSEVRAFGVEGAVIDRAPLPPPPGRRPVAWGRIYAAVALLLAGLGVASVALLRPGRGPG